jgi:hypothetical protein
MIIHDGTGSGFQAGVSDAHRLLVEADSHDAIITAATDGKAFRIATGLITLTSATASGLLYIKNNEASNLIVAEIEVRANQSTGGASGVGLWEIIRNPTAGTVVSNAVAAPIRVNINFGSTATISVDAFKGAEGSTFTDGSVYATENGMAVPHRVELLGAGRLVIPRGASIGIRYTPPAGNTSITVSAGTTLFLNSQFFSSHP